MAEITKELLKSLALANGVDLPDQRLDAVLKQYQEYLKLLAQLDSLPLAPCRHSHCFPCSE
jgi:hypothetical protein